MRRHQPTYSSQKAGKPAGNYPSARPARHAHHRRGHRGKRNQRQQLHIRGMAGIAVDRSPGMPGQHRAGQDQPARAQHDGGAVAQPLRSSQRVPQPERGAGHHGPGHAGDHRRSRQHRDRGPGAGRPRAARAHRRRVRAGCATTRATPAAAATPARPPGPPGTASWTAKVSVMVPGLPAGTTQPCCHPLTATGVRPGPGAGARHPAGVDAFGNDQHPGGVRGGGAHLAAARTPARRWQPEPPGRSAHWLAAAGSRQLGAVDDERRAGADQQLLLAGRQRDRVAIAGLAPQPARRPAARPRWSGSRCARTGPRPR